MQPHHVSYNPYLLCITQAEHVILWEEKQMLMKRFGGITYGVYILGNNGIVVFFHS